MSPSFNPLIAKRFSQASPFYHQSAHAQRALAEKMTECTKGHLPLSLDRVADIGCGTGFLSQTLLKNHRVAHLLLNDVSLAMLNIAHDNVRTLSDEIVLSNQDAQTIYLKQPVDLLLTSGMLQWLNDPLTFLERLHPQITPQGHLLLGSFLEGTFQEVTELIGVGLHYPDWARSLDTLSRNFNIIAEGTFTHALYFNTPREVLKHAQQTGVTGVRPFQWTTRKLKQFEQTYRLRFQTQNGLVLTYRAGYLLAQRK